MDPKPVEGLPLYKLDQSCHECGKLAVQRVEVDHPVRGRILVCGTCAVGIGAGW